MSDVTCTDISLPGSSRTEGLMNLPSTLLWGLLGSSEDRVLVEQDQEGPSVIVPLGWIH